MSNDLIGREALKKAIKDEFDLAIHNGDIMLMSKSGIVDRILAYIDNAPTVEERPQGEWGKWVVSEIRCPKCLEYYDSDCYSKEELNKCPNCGADMRGKDNG